MCCRPKSQHKVALYRVSQAIRQLAKTYNLLSDSGLEACREKTH